MKSKGILIYYLLLSILIAPISMGFADAAYTFETNISPKDVQTRTRDKKA